MATAVALVRQIGDAQMTVAIVVAYSTNRVIGAGGTIPWHLPGDMRYFRELTAGGTVLMGRRTFESLPDAYRPLPNRRNLVLSRRVSYAVPGAEVFDDLPAALAAAGHDCFVIGGAAIYVQALPCCTRVYATEINALIDGDVRFPELDADTWECVSESAPFSENNLEFVHRVYERRADDLAECSTSTDVASRAQGHRLYALEAARRTDQRARMERLEAAGICVFCRDHASVEQHDLVEFEGEHWYVKRNDFPYTGTLAHYLIIANRHVTSFTELPDAAGAELWAIKRRLATALMPRATATVERSGELELNGSSVAHLHTHFVVLGPDPVATVRFRVSARAAGEGQPRP